jgi:hypothetical protein
MTYIIMSPFIPTVQNTYPVYDKQPKLRVVEPSAKSSSNINVFGTEKLYNTKGLKESTRKGSLIDFYI